MKSEQEKKFKTKWNRGGGDNGSFCVAGIAGNLSASKLRICRAAYKDIKYRGRSVQVACKEEGNEGEVMRRG